MNISNFPNFRYITGTDRQYAVTDDGNVYSFKRETSRKLKTGSTTAKKDGKYSYDTVRIKQYGKFKVQLVHRLVAEAFMPTSDTTLVVNHINGDTHDNRLENLEWSTQRHNCNAGDRTARKSNPGKSVQYTPVVKLTMDGDFVEIYDSIYNAAKALSEEIGKPAKLNSIKTAINYVVLGYPHHSTVYGYKWRKATEEEKEYLMSIAEA